MGVVYKLKPEVIDFIRQQKADNPKMGCRNLATLTSEKFGLKVSKSSVSAVLKEADLNSPVGRPAEKTPKEKKFEIPQKKKDQIRKKVFSLTDKEDAKRPALMPDPVEAKPFKEGTAEEKPVQERKQRQEKRRQAQEHIFKGAGALLLLAYYWSLAAEAPLREALERHLQKHAPAKTGDWLDALLALGLHGKTPQSPPEEIQNLPFWRCTDFTPQALAKAWHDVSAQWQATPTFVADYTKEREQCFSEASGFSLVFEKTQAVFLDAQESGLWEKPHAGLPQTLARSTEEVAARFIGQTKPFIAESRPWQTQWTPAEDAVLKNCLAPEDSPLKEIKILGPDLEPLAHFSVIPQTPRPFIFGIYPGHQTFQEAVKNIQWAAKTSLYHAALDRMYQITDTHTQAFAHKVRVVGLWAEEAPLGALLTADTEAAAEHIAEQFLQKRPYFGQKGHLEAFFKDLEKEPFPRKAIAQESEEALQRAALDKAPDLWPFIEDFIEALEWHFWQHYVPEGFPDKDITNFISNIYNISGSLQETGRILEIYLDVGKEHPRRAWLERAIELINSQDIYSRKGQKAFFSLKFS